MQRGHTLIELVIVISILAVLAGAVAHPLFEASRGYQARSSRLQLLGEARLAMLRMLHEVRNAERMGGLGASLPVAEVTQIGVGDVRYRSNGSTLERSRDAGATWRPIARQLGSLLFRYYDSLGNPLSGSALTETERRRVRRVEIDSAWTHGDETVQVVSSTYFHNLAFTDD